MGAAAAAVVTDNMVPTISTPHRCVKGRVCQTDNKDATYCMDSSGEFKLEAVDKSYVTAMLKSEYSPTDLVIKCDATPKFSGSAETDVVWQQVIRIRGNGNCDPSITCHEMGHAAGLLHGGSAYPALPSEDSRLGCMIAHGYSGDLGSNIVSNINGTY
ncbi:hypothetical protein [Streptomyces parvus]|uniref:hypothetical protein n=1 Tax=Streptomyces parvus TaxID=66428 RepID=UPI003326BD2C